MEEHLLRCILVRKNSKTLQLKQKNVMSPAAKLLSIVTNTVGTSKQKRIDCPPPLPPPVLCHQCYAYCECVCKFEILCACVLIVIRMCNVYLTDNLLISYITKYFCSINCIGLHVLVVKQNADMTL